MHFVNLTLSLLGLMWILQAFAETSTFSPIKGVEATLVLEGSTLNVAVKGETHNLLGNEHTQAMRHPFR